MRAQLSDEAGSMPGCAARETALFEQHHVFPAELGQVIGGRTPYDATANNDHACLGGELALCHRLTALLCLPRKFSLPGSKRSNR